MSTKTFFKRIALGIVVALGLGMVTTPSAQAVLLSNSITLSSATATAIVGDTATVTATVRFQGNSSANAVGDSFGGNADSVTLRYSCDAPAGATCPTLGSLQSVTADTANVTTKAVGQIGVYRDVSTAGLTDSLTSTTATGRSPYLISTNARTNSAAIGNAFAVAGTYTYSFYLTGSGPNNVLTLSSGGTLVTWTITVTAPSTNATGGSANVYISSDTATASQARTLFQTATDSQIVAVRGSAATPAPVGYAYLVLRNSAGDTRIAVGSGFNPVQDSVTVIVSGPGLIRSTETGAGAKSATMSVSNGRDAGSIYGTETLTILNDGTAGTMTLTFSKGSTTLATKTVTFTGPSASLVANLTDSYTSLGQTVRLRGQLKDSGGNVLTSGSVYVFSSDTKIAGSVPTSAVFGQTGHVCSTFMSETTAATASLNCGITITDTGVVTLTVGDSWTIAASTWTSAAVTLTVTGNTIASATVAFDKATYAPGERAVITITTADAAGRAHAERATGTFSTVRSTPSNLSAVTDLPFRGTASGTATYSTSLTELLDSGIETRVVVMPTYGTDVSFTVEVPGFGTGVASTLVTATAKVVDPNATAIATAQAAADAATDAALEAIDAANAATDAANLAAEAADAATVAAEEARDAADAATAAVEALATEVATLMAALKAQITTLARTVAKIAKKVNA